MNWLTVFFGHLLGDLEEDPGVTNDHDGERQQEEAGEGEHVVRRFLPVGHEAPSSGALGEVDGVGDGHVMKNKHLWEKRSIRGLKL